jgi:hypothetical protein
VLTCPVTRAPERIVFAKLHFPIALHLRMYQQSANQYYSEQKAKLLVDYSRLNHRDLLSAAPWTSIDGLLESGTDQGQIACCYLSFSVV